MPIHADSQTDTIELAGGTNIALTADATSEKVTIAVVGKVASAAQADTLDGHHWSEVQTAITANNFDAGHSFGANGYQKLANGLIIQWGRFSVGEGTSYLSFPIPFPNAALSISNSVSNGGSVSMGIANRSSYSVFTGNGADGTFIATGY